MGIKWTITLNLIFFSIGWRIRQLSHIPAEKGTAPEHILSHRAVGTVGASEKHRSYFVYVIKTELEKHLKKELQCLFISHSESVQQYQSSSIRKQG